MTNLTRILRASVPALLAAATLIFAAAADAGAPGEALYQEHCAACHGARLEGEPDWRSRKPDGSLPAPPHDDTGHTWHHGDGLLFDYTRLGGAAALSIRGVTGFKSAMPAFAGVLTDDEIRSVLGFIKSRWGERERTYQAAVTAQE